jgi:hypothetical protein
MGDGDSMGRDPNGPTVGHREAGGYDDAMAKKKRKAKARAKNKANHGKRPNT